MHLHLQAIVTLLALVNPVVCGLMFMQIEGGRSRRDMLADSARAALAVGVILVIAALVGARILHLFGVSLDAFSVAGGGVLAWIGFSMLQAAPAARASAPADPAPSSPSLTPLILFAASPGTITGVITVSAVHTGLEFPVTALVAVVAATSVMWCVILLAIRAGRGSGGTTFVHETVTRFMGLIVVAMGIQFALTGFRAFMQE